MAPLPHDEVTANLFFDGLGICCFNRQKVWEIGFLRDDHHDHELILDIDGHPDMPIRIEDEPDVVIRIKTVGGISPHTQFPKGYFGSGTVTDRKKRPATLDDAENFGWVIDLENPRDIDHGTGRLTKPAGFPVTRTFIENAVFYTESLPVKRMHRLFDSENGYDLPDQEFDARMFGRANDLIGADIKCAVDGTINIVIERTHAQPRTFPLPHRPSNPWQISLTNMRSTPIRIQKQGDAVRQRSHGRRKGDFQLYYRAFKLDDERRKRALWGFADAIDFKSGRTDCNMVFAGTSPNLDGLF
jgi:hypothetical protein